MQLRKGIEKTRDLNSFVRETLHPATSLRLDGRELLQYRDIQLDITRSIKLLQVNAVIQWGNIRIHCTVSGSIVIPYPDRSNEGVLTFQGIDNYHHRILEKVFKSSDVVDTESLCIIAGEKVWSILCSLRVLDSSGGNILDAMILVALAGFQAFRKPDMDIVREDSSHRIHIYDEIEREALPLALHYIPMAVTIGIMKVKDSTEFALVIDPSQEELDAVDTRIVIFVNSHQELCFVQKPGGIPIPMEIIVRASNLAIQVSPQIHQILKEALMKLENDTVIERDKRLEIWQSIRAEELTHMET